MAFTFEATDVIVVVDVVLVVNVVAVALLLVADPIIFSCGQ